MKNFIEWISGILRSLFATSHEQEIENIDKEEIKEIVNQIENDFEKEAIGYYLQSISHNYPDEKMDKLFESYPKVYAMPIIKWDNYEKIDYKSLEIRDEIVKDKIKDYQDKDKYTLLGAYENYLLEKAKNKVEMLLNK
jgi:hypothetical protein